MFLPWLPFSVYKLLTVNYQLFFIIFFWIIVDAVCFYLYIVKGIPFKAGLYGLYVIIAVAGYFKWKKMMKKEQKEN